MSGVPLGDSGLRKRYAVLVLLLCVAAGCASIVAFEHYRPAFLDWVISEPQLMSDRINLVLLLAAIALAAPLLGAGAYLWRFGSNARRAGRFPIKTSPSGCDREGLLRGIAIFLIMVTGGLLVTIWQLSQLLRSQAP